MIDLSYLTEEEQEMILTVLKRDAELKKSEEQRIKKLRKTERDRGRLKYLTGEWFYETKYHRHRDRIHGSDIIRASMRHRKPVTILELSQRWSEKPSCVYGEKKDVYIPPELSGLIEDPSTQSQNERVDDEAQQERQRPQIKPRQNPFNSVRSQRDGARLNNGVKEADQTPAEGDSEDDGPVKAALERANARPISISKSLEDLASTPLQERWKTDPRSDVGMSMENVSAVTPNTKTSFSDPEQVKMMSMSVPAFMQQEMDCGNSDCASVSSFHYDRLRTCNTPSNFSTCSEVASMSSVTGSVMSIYSSEFGNVEVKGTIQFAIHYVQKLGEFHIFVVQCKDLAIADVKRNRSDPYVKCYLLPDKAKYGKKKTCVRKKTLDPTYNEILRFKVPMEMLKTQKLNISVWHNDTFGRNSFLGEVEVDLAEWDFNNTQMNEYLLKGRVQVPTSPKHSVGGEEMSAEIKVALRFLPQTSHSHKNKGNGEVQIWVKECKNLPISRGVSIDPFVKCAVLPDASRKNRQKTRVLKRSSNPVFNHTMVYDGFRQEDLKEACVELTVWDHDRLNNHFIGGIRLGPGTGKSYGTEVNWMDSNAAEAALWERMMQSENEWVEDTLPLRMMVMARMSR
ncbi:synaptotagmin-like protein 2 isoform X14 [Pseudorasbora parva]|uniref:synaptotagmin-like protein 2 isoform X14 n=1 Tax=Pseudorasbora parva TaxID=51549 RepID=UPI00351E636B